MAAPATGAAFQLVEPGPVANAENRLVTAYNAAVTEETTAIEAFRTDWPPQNSPPGPPPLPGAPTIYPLNPFFVGALDRAIQLGADGNYQTELRSFLQTFPQQDNHPYLRPEPVQMQTLFTKISFSTQPRKSGKGSKGGVKRHECRWPTCRFGGTLQKCMDHFFAEHVKLKFFACDHQDCGMRFLRKYDLDKHKRKQHAVPRPRERSQDEEVVAGPSRQTRSNDADRFQPYAGGRLVQPPSTTGRPIRRRPAAK